ncbi:helix-turn-helix domain-containing protein [Nocardia takedensis]|uniref:helix-turn-helix domain-containing protein n=1 Tax=Nocardia takedensis TaxID=259390 RepID=UPI0009FC383E|nr:helix-turn-helix transcriptional regulator [Nocardia takedensis]
MILTQEPRPVAFPATLRSLIESPSISSSRKKLARAIHVNEATVSHYLHGRAKPSFDALIGIAQFFDVSMDYLIFGERPEVVAGDESTLMKAQIRMAIAEASDLGGRHLDMFSRIARTLQNEISSTARALAELGDYSAPVGFVTNAEAIGMETCTRRVRVMTRIFQSDISDGEPGPFFEVVVNNLHQGRTYEYLLYGDIDGLGPQVNRLRELIEGAGVSRDIVRDNLQFRHLRQELVCAVCILDLDMPLVEQREPILRERHRGSITAEGVWAYMNVQREDAQGGFTIEPVYLESALRQFDRDWHAARRV